MSKRKKSPEPDGTTPQRVDSKSVRIKDALSVAIFVSGAVLGLGSFLDALSNAQALLTPRAISAGTVFSIFVAFWALISRFAHKKGYSNGFYFRWDIKHWTALLAIVALLWSPLWLRHLIGEKEDFLGSPVRLQHQEGETVEDTFGSDQAQEGSAKVDFEASLMENTDLDEIGEGSSTISFSETTEDGVSKIIPYIGKDSPNLVRPVLQQESELNGTDTFWNFLFPKFSIKLVNRESRPLVLTKIILDVVESFEDDTPIPVPVQSPYAPFSFKIVNEGFGSMINTNIEFNVVSLKFGEEEPPEAADHPYFKPPFKYRRDLGDIQVEKRIDLDKEFTNLGADVSSFRQISNYANNEESWGKVSEKSFYRLLKLDYLKEFNYITLGPSKTLEVELYVTGLLTYSFIDGNGTLTRVTVPFYCYISVAAPEVGAPESVSGEYDILLKERGKNYQVKQSVLHTINPGKAELIMLRVGALRSSVHNFSIRAVLSDGQELNSDPFSLRLIIPRRNLAQLRKSPDRR